MSVFKDLQSASFRNISFLVPNEEKTSGRKTARHEYPNSGRRYIEDLGRQPATYSVTAIISGNNAIQRRIRLEQELEAGGRGLLVHPSLGQLMVKVTNYSSRSDDNEVGQFTFSIEFEESAANITLNPASANVQSVSIAAERARAALDGSFVDKYTDTSFVSILKDLSDSVDSVLNDLTYYTGTISSIDTEALSDFNVDVNALKNILPIRVRSGYDLIDSVRTIYDSYDSLTRTIGNYFDSYKDLTDYGSEREAKDLITAKRIIEEDNLSSIEEHTQLNALIGMYEAAAWKDYHTDIDLLSAQTDLSGKYKELVQNDPDDSLAYDNDFRLAINDLRASVREVFEEKQQNIWRVVNISPNESSIALTAYRYYGDLDNVDELKNLNNNVNVAYFDEDIKGLT